MIVKTEKSRLKESGFILLDLQHIGWGPPTWGGGDLLYSVYGFKCSFHEHPHRQTQITCNQISGHPGAQPRHGLLLTK